MPTHGPLSNQPSILIIGAGVAGLACARALHSRGYGIQILEASDRVGGRLGSKLVDGVWCDLGFQVSMSNYSMLEELVPRDVVPRHSFIDGAVIWDGVRHIKVIDPKRAPLSVIDPIRSGLVGWQDLRGAARCRRWARAVTRGKSHDGTALDVMRRAGFRDQFIRCFLRPFFGGVFLDERLSVSADRFLRTVHRFATGHAELPGSGMQQLAQAMAEPIKPYIHFRSEVASVEPGTGVVCTDGSSIEADHIVLSLPWDITAHLLNREEMVVHASWTSTTAIHYQTSTSTGPPLIHLNGSSSGRVNLVCSPSSVAPGYVGNGLQSILVSLRPNDGQGDAPDPEVIKIEAGRIMNVDSGQWRHVSTTQIRQGLPCGDFSELMSNLPPGISVAGDWTSDPSIEQAVGSGFKAAENVQEGLS